MSPAETPSLAAIADRVGQLYSPPAVAIEVLRLTDEPEVDTVALCRTVESDPAMASKLLRVVNSSLYGLPQEVASLPQALALLGVQPLKLLVLGFALPDGLTDSLPGVVMRRYWTDTLTTATAARLIAEAGWGRLGDEALAAGLLAGIGKLALLGQLGEDYASLLESAEGKGIASAPRRIEPIEREALGFDHKELSAELVRRWHLPKRLADAIELQADDSDLDCLKGDQAVLAQSLRLANLTNRLVSRRELGVLRSLLDLGGDYCQLSQRQLNTIVESLQQKSQQLAEAMSATLIEGYDYQQTLIEAHARLTLLSEQSAVRMLGAPRSEGEIDEDEQLLRDMLLETRRLSAAARVFIAGGLDPRTDGPTPDTEGRATPRRPHHTDKPPLYPRKQLLEKTSQLAASCRKARTSLALSALQLSSVEAPFDVNVLALRDWLRSSPWAEDFEDAHWAPTTTDRATVWLPRLERLEAKKQWTQVAKALEASTPLRLNVGVAGVAHVSPKFEGKLLLEAAERCLNGAIAATGPSIKSIEVF